MTPKHKLLLEKKDLLVAAMAAFEADLSEANEKAMNDLTSEVSILTAEVVAEEAQFAADAASLKEKSVNAPALHLKKQAPYSLPKFLLALADPTARADAGYEFEMSQEAARLSKKSTSTPMIPWGVFNTKAAQDTITAPSGGTDLGMSLAQPANHEDLFTVTANFLQSAAGQLGVPIYQAPLGSFKVPRLVQPIVPAWVARDADVPTDDARFDALDAVPHTLGAVVQINRSALIDTAPPMQDIIQQELWNAVLNALDQALLGAPTPDEDQPLGLYNAIAAAATWDYGAFATPLELLTALAETADRSSGEVQAMIASRRFQVWARTTAMSATLTATPLLPSADGKLMDGLNQVWNGRMTAFNADGTPAPTPPAVNNHAIFGPFASHVMTVLFGGGIELAVNPYASTVYAKGAILVRCMTDADILCRDINRFGMGFVAA